MYRYAISDRDYERIKDLLPGQPGKPGRNARDNRLFIDAVLYVARTDIPWEELPERVGTSPHGEAAWRRLAVHDGRCAGEAEAPLPVRHTVKLH
ncbi:transposase [Rhodocaloribacter litoris]|nr:transposase [Rhodocaloribacter litoris]